MKLATRKAVSVSVQRRLQLQTARVRAPAMRERFPQLVRTDSSLNQFLKSIEQSMKASGT